MSGERYKLSIDWPIPDAGKPVSMVRVNLRYLRAALGAVCRAVNRMDIGGAPVIIEIRRIP